MHCLEQRRGLTEVGQCEEHEVSAAGEEPQREESIRSSAFSFRNLSL